MAGEVFEDILLDKLHTKVRVVDALDFVADTANYGGAGISRHMGY